MLCLIVVLVSMPKAALDWRGGGEWRGEVGKGQSEKREATRRDARQAEDGRRSERLLFVELFAYVGIPTM